MTATSNPTAVKFRRMAATLAAKIEEMRMPRLDNTPKRAYQAASRRIDAAHAERVKNALERLADAWEAGSVPEPLRDIKVYGQLHDMLRTRIDTSGPGRFALRDTGEYADESGLAKALRAFLIPVDTGEAIAEQQRLAARKRLDRIAEMEAAVRFQDIPGFFPTPPDVCALIRHRAGLDNPVSQGLRVLEPSAGIGTLAEAMRKNYAGHPTGADIRCVEINKTLADVLAAKGFLVTVGDFESISFAALNFTERDLFDIVVMNPPFESGQDAAHVRKAWEFLKTGGRLVSVMSGSAFQRSDRPARAFQEWFLEEIDGEVEPLPEGSFRNSFNPTGVNAVLVVANKRS